MRWGTHRLISFALLGTLASPAAAQDAEEAPPPEEDVRDEAADELPAMDTPQQRDRHRDIARRLGCMELAHDACLGLGGPATGFGVFPPLEAGDDAHAVCLNPR